MTASPSRLSLVPVALLLAFCAPALSQPAEAPPPAQSRDSIGSAATLAATCSGCHGTASGGSEIVTLSGYTREQLYTRFQHYRQSSNGDTAMHRMARGYSDQQVRLIADYLGQP